MKNQKLDFENMGIYDLRNYARSIGVLSPTKFRRDELIQKITAIIMGEQPEQKKTNKGRPPKHKINEQSKLDFILPNNLFDNNNPNYKAFQQQVSPQYDALDLLRDNSNSTTTNILYDGYYKPYDVNFGFVLKKGYLSDYYKENVVILNDLAQQYNLQEGDYITGASSYLQNKNLMLATSVLTINNTNLQYINQPTKYDLTKIVKPTQKICLDDGYSADFAIIDKICPIAKGTRVLINFEDKDQVKNTMIDMLNSISQKNNITTFLFSIDDLPEEIYDIDYKCPEIQLVNYGFNMQRQNYNQMTNLKIKHLQRLVEQGNDVAFVCYNAQNYKNNIATDAVISDGLSQESAAVYAQNKLKDLFCMARNLEHGSLTTIFLNDNTNALADVCNTYICFNSKKLPQTNIAVNISSSFTRNMQDLVTSDELKKVKDFKTNLTDDNLILKINELLNNK